MKMKLTLSVLGALAMAAGCTQDKKSSTMPMQSSALAAPAAPIAPAVQYTPPPAPQPVVYDAPREQAVSADSVADASDTIAPTSASPAPRPAKTVASPRHSSASSAKGTKYVIKKGDSLWSIAKTHYGDGNKWKQIASANPKLDPNKVMVGQTITLP